MRLAGNNQTLNGRLAEWAGFFYDEGAEYAGGGGNNNRLMHGLWFAPNDSKVGATQPPPFTESLDACIKWLASKLDFVKIVINVAPSGDIFWNAEISRGGHPYNFVATAETPALAFCVAVEKLDDEERKELSDAFR